MPLPESGESYTQEGIGEPRQLELLYTPYRMAYLHGESKPVEGGAKDCPFCRIPAEGDDERFLVVHRGELNYVVLNLFPYQSGHLMVVPFRHIPNYVDTSHDEMVEMGELTRTAIRTIKRVSSPDGFNIGMNQGEAGGAGIAAHLHQHVVPRWVGDNNFLPTIGMTKALPQLLADTRRLFAEAWGD